MSSINPSEKLALLRNNFMVACSEYVDYYHSPCDTVSLEILEAEVRRHGQKYQAFKKELNSSYREKSPTE